MEAPIGVILFGGWIAEFLAVGLLLSAFAVVAAAIALVVTLWVYVKRLRLAQQRGDRAWLANLLIAPIVGTAIGFVIGYAVGHSPSETAAHPHGAGYVLTILCGLYGFWIAPFHAPYLLISDPEDHRASSGPLNWALAYPAFALLAFAYTLVPVLLHTRK
jgi:hypothetical protein